MRYKQGDKVVCSSSTYVIERVNVGCNFYELTNGLNVMDSSINHEATEKLKLEDSARVLREEINDTMVSDFYKQFIKYDEFGTVDKVWGIDYGQYVDRTTGAVLDWGVDFDAETKFNKARDHVMALNSDIAGIWRKKKGKSIRTTCKLKDGATARITKFHSDDNCDLTACFMAYAEALKESSKLDVFWTPYDMDEPYTLSLNKDALVGNYFKFEEK